MDRLLRPATAAGMLRRLITHSNPLNTKLNRRFLKFLKPLLRAHTLLVLRAPSLDLQRGVFRFGGRSLLA